MLDPDKVLILVGVEQYLLSLRQPLDGQQAVTQLGCLLKFQILRRFLHLVF